MVSTITSHRTVPILTVVLLLIGLTAAIGVAAAVPSDGAYAESSGEDSEVNVSKSYVHNPKPGVYFVSVPEEMTCCNAQEPVDDMVYDFKQTHQLAGSVGQDIGAASLDTTSNSNGMTDSGEDYDRNDFGDAWVDTSTDFSGFKSSDQKRAEVEGETSTGWWGSEPAYNADTVTVGFSVKFDVYEATISAPPAYNRGGHRVSDSSSYPNAYTGSYDYGGIQAHAEGGSFIEDVTATDYGKFRFESTRQTAYSSTFVEILSS